MMKILALVFGILSSFIVISAIILHFVAGLAMDSFNTFIISWTIVGIGGFYLYDSMAHHSDRPTSLHIPRTILISILCLIIIILFFFGWAWMEGMKGFS